MKLSQFFLLFTTLMLASCSSLESGPSMEETNLPDNSVQKDTVTTDGDVPETSHTSSLISSKYLHLLDIVEKMRVFNEEQMALVLTHPVLIEGKEEELANPAKQRIQQNLQAQNDFISTIYDQTLSLLNKKQDIDQYLNFLLSFRRSYLKGRQVCVRESLDFHSPNGTMTLPSSKRLFNFMMEDKQWSAHDRSYNASFRRHTVSRFELLNLLIKEVFTKCMLEELQPGTVALLAASVQLHPILKGERRDLGHPDEAGGPYALLELIGTDFAPHKPAFIDKLKRLMDISSLKEQAKNINPDQPNTTFLFALSEKIKLHENIKIREVVPSDIKEGFMQFMNLGTPKGEKRGHGITIKKYQVEAQQRTEKEALKKAKRNAEIKSMLFDIKKDLELHQDKHTLTYPAFLKPEQAHQPADEDRFFQTSGKEDKKKASIPSLSIRTDNNNSKVPLAPQDVEVQEVKKVPSTYLVSLQEEVSAKPSKEEVKEISVVGKSANNLIDSQEIGIIQTAQLATSFSFATDWVLPQGLRSFHSQMLKHTYPLRSIKSHQDIVDQLFDPLQQRNITFKAFKGLWKATGGQIIGTNGGSHKELIGPQEEPLFGIFAHGDSQVYGPSYIKYLQTAVLYVGLRPTKGV